MEQVYEIKAHISWEEAVSKGQDLRSAKDNSQWDLGDLSLEVDTAYGQDSLDKFANDIGINKKSLQQYRRVSAAFTKEQRNPYLSHRHHLLLVPQEDRLKWLELANDNNWTVSQLERELALSRGENPTPPKPVIIECDTCHKYRIDGETCQCYRI
jgi:hypothetical protein